MSCIYESIWNVKLWHAYMKSIWHVNKWKAYACNAYMKCIYEKHTHEMNIWGAYACNVYMKAYIWDGYVCKEKEEWVCYD